MEEKGSEYRNTIILGNSLEVLKTLPSDLVDCIITSPPYYGLRDYGVDGQIGLEKSLAEYLDRMLAITAELKRILKPTGTLWWNHGDSYGGSGGNHKETHKNDSGFQGKVGPRSGGKGTIGIYEKSLLLQAHRLAIRMIDEQGWIMRNQIIWHKPNVMPASVKDRFTVDFEPVFFFTKSKKYWFEPQYEPLAESSIKARNYKLNQTTHEGAQMNAVNVQLGDAPRGTRFVPLAGRNKRTVWKVATHPFREAHFATFPEALIQPMIKAGCPEAVCTKCGIARERIIEVKKPEPRLVSARTPEGQSSHGTFSKERSDDPYLYESKGFTDCGCGAEFEKGLVLDPFFGAGTTGLVAKKLGRDYLGIELNTEYIKIAEKRLVQDILI